MNLMDLMGLQAAQQGGGLGSLPRNQRTGLALYGIGDILRGGSGTGAITLGSAFLGSQKEREEAERKRRAEQQANEQWSSLGSMMGGGQATPGGGQSVMGQRVGTPSMSGGNTPTGIATDAMVALGRQTGGNPYRDAIASIESAGSGDYSAVGPTHPSMGRALGRYQVMESNIGPWSREVLGREVTPEEFLATPQIQDAIFDAKFGGYAEQFGPEGAAQAWFSGPGGVGKMGRSDSLGTTNQAYTDKFNAALGGGDRRVSQAGTTRTDATPQPPGMLNQRMVSGLEAIMANPNQPTERRKLAEMRLKRHYDAVNQRYENQIKPRYNQITGQEAESLGLDPSGVYNIGPDGRVSQIGGGGTSVTVNNVPQPGLGGEYSQPVTPGQEKVDKEFADRYLDWTEGGGADTLSQVAKIEEVADQLESGDQNFTGPLVGNLPDMVGTVVAPNAIQAREQVEEVVQRNLRTVLGAQFTEKEGERLISRAYNPRLSEEQNAKRLRRLASAMRAAADAKNAQMEYFQKNGTLTGWEGRTWSVDDFISVIDGKKPGKVEQEGPNRLRYNPETGRLE